MGRKLTVPLLLFLHQKIDTLLNNDSVSACHENDKYSIFSIISVLKRLLIIIIFIPFVYFYNIAHY